MRESFVICDRCGLRVDAREQYAQRHEWVQFTYMAGDLAREICPTCVNEILPLRRPGTQGLE